jgi:TonB-linked SusC/RagA family outer membrane protein
MRKQLLLLSGFVLCSIVMLAQRTVTGKVTDDKGNPVANASVIVKGTTTGTTSKTDGSYSLTVPANAKALIFSSVNMNTVEKAIGPDAVIDAALTVTAVDIQEVVVVGYGTQRRKEITGSLANIKGAAVADKPIQSFDQALAGRATGVQITVPNGVLNAPPVFRIRGTNSISLSSYPLIVVDGIPAPTGDFSSTSAAGNALSSINPNDIESIDIAKDAAATAIYGSRAANGVVYITTKKGKPGRAKVTYSGNVSWTSPYGIPEVLNAQQYTDYKNSAIANHATLSTTATRFNLAQDANGKTIDTKWEDYIYQTGFSHAHNIGVSGGNDNTTYYMGAGFTDQEGILRKNEFRRRNILLNVDSRVNSFITIGGKVAYSNELNTAATGSGSLPGEAFATTGLGRLQFVTAPNVAPYLNNGAYNIIPQNIIGPMNNVLNVTTPAASQVGFYNPVTVLDLNRSNSEANHIQSNLFLQIKPVSWLTLKTMYGIDYYFVDNEIFQSPVHGDGFAAIGSASSTVGKSKRWTWNNTAQVDKVFAENHTTSLLIGQEQDRRTFVGFGLNRTQISDPVYQIIQAGWGLNNPSGLGFGENYLLSEFGRLNYDFKKKYYFTANVRRDEYSAFADKSEIFWGGSLAWSVDKENFFETAGLSKIFSSLRVRGSYGKVGNVNGIGDYPTYSTFGSGLYGGNPTLVYNQAGNPNLQWETSTKTDVGINFGLFKERLNVDFAWYNNDIEDLILNVPQAPSAGLPSSVPTNVGTMYNRGIELEIRGVPFRTKDFTWNSTLTYTYNKNMVTSLAPGLNEILTSTSGLETVSRTAPGYSLGQLWLVRNAGVDPATGRRILLNLAGEQVLYGPPGSGAQFTWTRTNGTQYSEPGQPVGVGVTQAKDGVMFGNVIPKHFGGWDNTFKYKNFDLNVLLTYQLGFWVYYGSWAGLHDQRFWNNATDVLDAWKKPGDITTVPRPIYNDNVSNGSALPMSYSAFKGDFVKVKNVSLSYSLPNSLLSKAKMTSARIFVSGQNLAIITDYPGPDPEVSSNGNGNTNQGIDRNTIANGRTITVGINIGF